MTSTPSNRVPIRVAAALVACIPAVAMAQSAEPLGASDRLIDSPRDAFRVGLSADLVQRSFRVTGASTPVRFEAPTYPGLALHAEVAPLAWFMPESAWSRLAVGFSVGKHHLQTGVQVAADPEPIDLKIPTRHDETWFGASFDWRPTEQVTLVPRIGLRSVEFSLGGNPIYTSSFYQSAELGAEAGWVGVRQRWLARAGFLLRPSVDMGSTSEVFGSDPDVSGWAATLSGEWRFTPVWIARGEARYDAYRGSFALGDGADAARSELQDSHTSFVVGLDWAY